MSQFASHFAYARISERNLWVIERKPGPLLISRDYAVVVRSRHVSVRINRLASVDALF